MMALDIYRSPPSTRGKLLPSLSVLTGNVLESSALSLIDKSFKDMQSSGGRSCAAWSSRSNSEASTSAPSRPSTGQVGSLTGAAARHLGQLQRATPAPYQRLMTPEDHCELRAQAVAHLKQLAASFRESQAAAAAAADAARSDPCQAPASPSSRPGGEPPVAPAPGGHPPHRRPGTSLSVSDLQMERPLPRKRRLSSPLSASWGGATAHQGDCPPSSRGGCHTPSRLGTPSRMVSASAALLRASTPMPLAPTRLVDVWRSPAAGTPGASSSSNTTNPAFTTSLAELARQNSDRPGGAPPSRGGTADGRHTWDSSSTAAAVLAAPGRPFRAAIGTKAAHVTGALEDFVPTRGMLYSVFAELDSMDTGKLTYSAFEEAACLIGMRSEHSKSFFEQLDTTGRGFINVNEWGSRDKQAQVLNFTRLYVQQTRGPSGRHKDSKEILTLPMAIEMAMHRLALRNNGRSISSQRLVDAFRFIDTDKSGNLDRYEMADAFSALGIAVPPSIVESAMQTFDKDRSGTIDYNEFLRTLFPTLSKGAYNMSG